MGRPGVQLRPGLLVAPAGVPVHWIDYRPPGKFHCAVDTAGLLAQVSGDRLSACAGTVGLHGSRKLAGRPRRRDAPWHKSKGDRLRPTDRLRLPLRRRHDRRRSHHGRLLPKGVGPADRHAAAGHRHLCHRHAQSPHGRGHEDGRSGGLRLPYGLGDRGGHPHRDGTSDRAGATSDRRRLGIGLSASAYFGRGHSGPADHLRGIQQAPAPAHAHGPT